MNLDELSMKLKWKAKLQRAKVGPNKKAIPSYLRNIDSSPSPSADYQRYKEKKKREGQHPLSFSDWIKRHG